MSADTTESRESREACEGDALGVKRQRREATDVEEVVVATPTVPRKCSDFAFKFQVEFLIKCTDGGVELPFRLHMPDAQLKGAEALAHSRMRDAKEVRCNGMTLSRKHGVFTKGALLRFARTVHAQRETGSVNGLGPTFRMAVNAGDMTRLMERYPGKCMSEYLHMHNYPDVVDVQFTFDDA